MNVSSPWSRRVGTQPASVTSLPASEARGSPQVCVRSTYLVPIILEKWRLARGARLVLVRVRRALVERRRLVLGYVATDLGHHRGEPRHALRLGDEVANDHVAPACLGRAADDGDLRAVLDRALQLLVERTVGVIDRDVEARLAQRVRDLQAIGAIGFLGRQDI